MDSSSSPQSNIKPQASSKDTNEKGAPSQEQVRKRTPGFSRESLMNNLEDIAKETNGIKQELPKETNKSEKASIQQEIQALDRKQRVWLVFYCGWLMYHIWQNVPMGVALASSGVIEMLSDLSVIKILGSILAMAIMTAPYLLQLLAIFKKSLKLNNIGLKIIAFYGWLGFIQLAFLCLTLYDYGFYKKTVEIIFQQFGLVEASDGNKVQYPAREEYNWMVYETIAESLIHFVLTYGGAKLYQRYLLKRQNLLLLKEKSE